MKSTKIIVVDLDGTLTFSDTLYESIIALFRNKPFLIFNLPLGLAKGIAYLKLKVAEIISELHTNAISTISLLTIIANRFEAKKEGIICVISSVAGDRGRASNYVYGSAKAMITSFTSGLRQRLNKSNVSVVTIKPGLIDTPMTSKFKKGFFWVKPNTVAIKIVKAIQKKKNRSLYSKFLVDSNDSHQSCTK